MEISTILPILFIVAMDVILFVIDRRNKIIFRGRNKYGIIVPVMVAVFIVVTIASKSFVLNAYNIILLIAILPIAVLGNKSGLTEKGILLNSYVAIWEKIESYSLDEEASRYVLLYKTNAGVRRIYFKKENIEEVRKYLSRTINYKHYRR